MSRTISFWRKYFILKFYSWNSSNKRCIAGLTSSDVWQDYNLPTLYGHFQNASGFDTIYYSRNCIHKFHIDQLKSETEVLGGHVSNHLGGVIFQNKIFPFSEDTSHVYPLWIVSISRKHRPDYQGKKYTFKNSSHASLYFKCKISF